MTVFLLYRGKNLHCERSLSLEIKLFRVQFAALDAVSGIVAFV
jgi:hypothetical protein